MEEGEIEWRLLVGVNEQFLVFRKDGEGDGEGSKVIVRDVECGSTVMSPRW